MWKALEGNYLYDWKGKRRCTSALTGRSRSRRSLTTPRPTEPTFPAAPVTRMGVLFDNGYSCNVIRYKYESTYRDVCSHNICHVKAVQVEFDPNEVFYENLVDLFWSIHNLTTKKRQG